MLVARKEPSDELEINEQVQVFSFINIVLFVLEPVLGIWVEL